MKWQGRQGSDNIEDRRGMSGGKMALGGGIGTIVIVLLVLLLGGDPSSLLNNEGSSSSTTGEYQSTAEEEDLVQFVKVVLKDTETVWGKIFEQSGSTYRMPTLVFSVTRCSQPVAMQLLPAVRSTVREMKRFI
jgi:predicted metalloprotease